MKASRRRQEDGVTDPEMIEELGDFFDTIKAPDGNLKRDDFKRVLNTYAVRGFPSDVIDDAFNEADPNKTGTITRDTFVSMMSDKMKQTSNQAGLTQAFETFDPKQDKTIDKAKFVTLLKNIGKPLTPDEINEFLAIVKSANNDEEIRYELFIQEVFAKK
ncbi:myosin regulatory light chain, putative [Entamoeba invadens IP1]|uniref:Myosin regulatory light chain, putative n=1 Tax=Entamoeba invadens IP1 TaxID=370355 RepID=L7FNJ3_ENTIV|nr:myosin regulatory light chain, putative [Entamoeba invadens IP1]ELP88560.1 myosin regulatory light chain, putative [Entamoeba invadens IP1]|eukprot:XP_004255331.1 myosin regulatory light chain, putative [Entamoeba invadens IP1]